MSMAVLISKDQSRHIRNPVTLYLELDQSLVSRGLLVLAAQSPRSHGRSDAVCDSSLVSPYVLVHTAQSALSNVYEQR